MPNPLFDFVVLSAGYSQELPLDRFWLWTVFGRAVVKAPLEALYVIFLFSKGHVERFLLVLRNYNVHPKIVDMLQQFFTSQRQVFLNPRVSPVVPIIFLLCIITYHIM